MALFFQGIKQIGNNFCVISLKTYTKKTKHSKFYYSFQLSFFLTWKLGHNPYMIELFRLKFLMQARRHCSTVAIVIPLDFLSKTKIRPF